MNHAIPALRGLKLPVGPATRTKHGVGIRNTLICSFLVSSSEFLERGGYRLDGELWYEGISDDVHQSRSMGMNADVAALQTRPSLLIRLRDVGDAETWQTFVRIYAPLVYGFGRRNGLQDADVADLRKTS